MNIIIIIEWAELVHRIACKMSGQHGIQNTYTVDVKESPGVTTRLLNQSSSSPEPQLPSNTAIKVYPWRWVVLAIFTLNNAVTNYLWIMSSVVADVMLCYYSISETMLNLLSTSYMMVYIVMVIPAVWLINNHGLKTPTVIASGMMTLGAALRVAGSGNSETRVLYIAPRAGIKTENLKCVIVQSYDHIPKLTTCCLYIYIYIYIYIVPLKTTPHIAQA